MTSHYDPYFDETNAYRYIGKNINPDKKRLQAARIDKIFCIIVIILAIASEAFLTWRYFVFQNVNATVEDVQILKYSSKYTERGIAQISYEIDGDYYHSSFRFNDEKESFQKDDVVTVRASKIFPDEIYRENAQLLFLIFPVILCPLFIFLSKVSKQQQFMRIEQREIIQNQRKGKKNF